MFLFHLKKLLGKLLLPLPLSGLLIVVALLCYFLGRKRLAKGLGAAVILGVLVLSLPVVSYRLVAPLEYRYEKYLGQPVDYVVVHGGYHRTDERQPLTSLLTRETFVRLMEGIRVYKLNPGSKLLFSGSLKDDDISHPEAMARVAETFGVPREDMILATNAVDTEDEVLIWIEKIGDATFAAVTTAMDMPRAMFWYRVYGANPIPAPTAFYTRGDGRCDWWSFVPSARSLASVERAWYEYLGLAWSYLRLQLSPGSPQTDNSQAASGDVD